MEVEITRVDWTLICSKIPILRPPFGLLKVVLLVRWYRIQYLKKNTIWDVQRAVSIVKYSVFLVILIAKFYCISNNKVNIMKIISLISQGHIRRMWSVCDFSVYIIRRYLPVLLTCSMFHQTRAPPEGKTFLTA